MPPIQEAEYIDISNTHDEVEDEVETESTEPAEETKPEQESSEGDMFYDGGLN